MRALFVVFVFAMSVPAMALGPSRTLPAGQTKIEKRDRVLLTAIDFVTFGDPRYAWLYKFLNTSGVLLTKTMMNPSYHKSYLLGGANATSANFVSALSNITADPSVKALDTFVHLHGSSGGAMWFTDGAAYASDLRSSIAERDVGGKLRLFYTTACFGADAAPDMISAGFKVASGAIAVNADSTWAFPTTMIGWGGGYPYREVVKAANNSVSIWISDKAAQAMGFGSDINSKKLMFGDGNTRIDGIQVGEQ